MSAVGVAPSPPSLEGVSAHFSHSENLSKHAAGRVRWCKPICGEDLLNSGAQDKPHESPHLVNWDDPEGWDGEW